MSEEKMNLNPLALLEKAINEHGSSAILKERLEHVKDLLDKAVKEKSELENELEKARMEIGQLKTRIPNIEFVEYRGVKLKRKPSGGFEETAYCTCCEAGMGSIDGDMPFACGKCHALSGFNARELASVMKEAESEYPIVP